MHAHPANPALASEAGFTPETQHWRWFQAHDKKFVALADPSPPGEK
jgi:hypothetical protein